MKFGDVLRLSKARCADPLAEGLVRYVGQEHRGSGDLRIPSWGNIQFSAIPDFRYALSFLAVNVRYEVSPIKSQ